MRRRIMRARAISVGLCVLLAGARAGSQGTASSGIQAPPARDSGARGRLSPSAKAFLTVGLTVWAAATQAGSPPAAIVGAVIAAGGLGIQFRERWRAVGFRRAFAEPLLPTGTAAWMVISAAAMTTGLILESQLLTAIGGTALLLSVGTHALAESESWAAQGGSARRVRKGVADGILAMDQESQRAPDSTIDPTP